MDLKNKKIVIVGASSGMGLATALHLHKRGAHVVMVGRDAIKLEAAAKAVVADHDNITTVAADMTTDEGRRAIIQASDTIDHLVVTAAELAYTPLKDITPEAVDRVIHSKLVGPLFLAQAALPRLSTEGSITFISGIAAERPIPGGALTGAVNGGLNALVRGMALEFSPVRVNTISPGWVETPIWDHVMPDTTRRETAFASMSAKIPARRIGRPEDIAHAIESVITNGFMNGSTVYVDGGQRLI